MWLDANLYRWKRNCTTCQYLIDKISFGVLNCGIVACGKVNTIEEVPPSPDKLLQELRISMSRDHRVERFYILCLVYWGEMCNLWWMEQEKVRCIWFVYVVAKTFLIGKPIGSNNSGGGDTWRKTMAKNKQLGKPARFSSSGFRKGNNSATVDCLSTLTCPNCGRGYSQKGSLNRHLK